MAVQQHMLEHAFRGRLVTNVWLMCTARVQSRTSLLLYAMSSLGSQCSGKVHLKIGVDCMHELLNMCRQ